MTYLAILVGGGIGGAFDLAFALVFNGVRGAPPMRVLHFIASGLLGRGAFDGGVATAALGVALHFVIALGAATVYAAIVRALPALHRRPIVAGMVFGAGIYATMHLLVLPLSAVPALTHRPFPMACDLACHMLLIGPSIAVAAAAFRRT
jgi:uncharacterized membrane protein YagU involved in acid resistance